MPQPHPTVHETPIPRDGRLIALAGHRAIRTLHHHILDQHEDPEVRSAMVATAVAELGTFLPALLEALPEGARLHVGVMVEAPPK